MYNLFDHPLTLDCCDYDDWKSRMRMHIKAMDQTVWLTVLTGWDPPTELNGDGHLVVKSELDWTDSEMDSSNLNSKALHAIFCAVDEGMYRLILRKCKSAKDAWEAIEKQHARSARVREARAGILYLKYINLRMGEKETIPTYFAKLMDLASKLRALDRPISDDELYDKMLTSLPKRFDAKVFVMGEVRDSFTSHLRRDTDTITSHMKLRELAGVLEEFESRFN